ncbi:DUF6503 family protein [Pontibacter sp. MBLB2868]|uniref:DUF6503 family protein n=1 Tax=Pontibacter sp. MBLB2868 TaxID=3451555 RepID=UPI003F74E829
MNTIRLLLSLLCVFVLACLPGCSSDDEPNAQEIVDAAIAAHGGANLDQAVVSFRLRDKQYRALRDKDAYLYSRTFTDDSTGQRIHDVLTNSGFTRTVDSEKVELPQERKDAYSASVNSVIYFALLPYFLNDAAVKKAYLGEAKVKGEPYYKVKVTFVQNGGGEDHEDEYVYWIHQKKHTMDYLAYSYVEEDGKGSRFREAVNPRKIGGVLFQDYVNYTSRKDFPLQNYDKAFEKGELEKVSEINLEEVQLSELPEN